MLLNEVPTKNTIRNTFVVSSLIRQFEKSVSYRNSSRIRISANSSQCERANDNHLAIQYPWKL